VISPLTTNLAHAPHSGADVTQSVAVSEGMAAVVLQKERRWYADGSHSPRP